MNPVAFPEANCRFGPPEGMAESQVATIHAWHAEAKSGSVDGSEMTVTCWQPTPEERAAIAAGGPVFISFLGGLPPHFLCTDFITASHPA